MTAEPLPPSPDPIASALATLGAEFALRDRVRHVTQAEGKPGIVTGVTIREHFLIYLVRWSATCESGHYGFELEVAEENGWIDS